MSKQTITIYKCDRCGREETDSGKVEESWVTTSSNTAFEDILTKTLLPAYGGHNLHVCDECRLDFKQWWQHAALTAKEEA